PFYLSQLLVAPTRSVPLTVREAMAARLARLSAAAREAVEYAAVVGPRVDVALIARIEAVAPSGLDACIEAGLLLTYNEQLAFRHELLREAVLALVSPPRLLALHRFAELGAHREATPQYVSPRERDVVG